MLIRSVRSLLPVALVAALLPLGACDREQEYVPRDQAIETVLDNEGLDAPPDDLLVRFDDDPAKWTETSAVWSVSSRSELIGSVVDAESGRIIMRQETSTD